MKYQIVVEKINDSMFLAYSPVINNLWACGESLDATLADLRKGFLCFLHDPEAEMDVVVRSGKPNPEAIRADDSKYLM